MSSDRCSKTKPLISFLYSICPDSSYYFYKRKLLTFVKVYELNEHIFMACLEMMVAKNNCSLLQRGGERQFY